MNDGKKVIAVTGLSGVGKSTILRRAGEIVKFTHLEASALIKAARQRGGHALVSSEALRKGHIHKNQQWLIDGFKIATANMDGIVVLDCHTIIDTPSGIKKIPVGVFGEISVLRFIFVQAEAETILRHRHGDEDRDRPDRTIAEIAYQQARAEAYTREVARQLLCDFLIVGLDEMQLGRALRL